MENLTIIDTIEGVDDLRERLKEAKFVAFDTETAGVKKGCSVIGYSVCFNPEEAFYVITRKWEEEKIVTLPTAEHSIELIKDLQQHNLIMHNAVFDCRVVKDEYQIELIDAVHTDTMVLAHIIDENRPVGLKDLGAEEFGEDAVKEQKKMKESIVANGGSATKVNYELYKADPYLIARYGAKDALLTLKIFLKYVPRLVEHNLKNFFYDDEVMPLLRATTYSLNTRGLKVDVKKLQALKATLKEESQMLQAQILEEIKPHIEEEYPGTKKTNCFNINSNQQLAWLLYIKLGNQFSKLTKKGKEISKSLTTRIAYSPSDKAKFIKLCREEGIKPEKYMQIDGKALKDLEHRHPWLRKLFDYRKAQKLLKTYVKGIEERVEYGVIYPSFFQHGTTSGRYSSRNPNFQNLPRDDTRVKDCIVARKGKVFIGADYSQLEPRVFSSVSQDPALLACFEQGQDFYSVIGMAVYSQPHCSPFKEAPNAFANNKVLRQNSKVFALANAYGTTPYKMSESLRDEEGQLLSLDECGELQDNYFQQFPALKQMMIDSHNMAKQEGVVYSLYGRPRHIPDALHIGKFYGNVTHSQLPYKYRTVLNLAVNHRIQSSAASIINRASIAFMDKIKELGYDAIIVMQVHDEIIVECAEEKAEEVAAVLKHCMETTVELPGIKLIAEPKIGKTLAECK